MLLAICDLGEGRRLRGRNLCDSLPVTASMSNSVVVAARAGSIQRVIFLEAWHSGSLHAGLPHTSILVAATTGNP